MYHYDQSRDRAAPFHFHLIYTLAFFAGNPMARELTIVSDGKPVKLVLAKASLLVKYSGETSSMSINELIYFYAV